jgi:hypothetical protein
MRFTDLVLHAHLISNGLEAIGIIGHQHLGSHTLSNGLDPLGERLAIFCCQCIDSQGQTADGVNGDA